MPGVHYLDKSTNFYSMPHVKLDSDLLQFDRNQPVASAFPENHRPIQRP